MHVAGYKGQKLQREKAQRIALIRSLASALILNHSIETTHPKAKALVPFAERLITLAKKNTLHSRRQLISRLNSAELAHLLIDEIAPKLGGRNSGHFRIVKTRLRRGDNAQMAEVSFVDDLTKKSTVKKAKVPEKQPKEEATSKAPPKTAAEKSKASKTSSKTTKSSKDSKK